MKHRVYDSCAVFICAVVIATIAIITEFSAFRQCFHFRFHSTL